MEYDIEYGIEYVSKECLDPGLRDCDYFLNDVVVVYFFYDPEIGEYHIVKGKAEVSIAAVANCTVFVRLDEEFRSNEGRRWRCLGVDRNDPHLLRASELDDIRKDEKYLKEWLEAAQKLPLRLGHQEAFLRAVRTKAT